MIADGSNQIYVRDELATYPRVSPSPFCMEFVSPSLWLCGWHSIWSQQKPEVKNLDYFDI